MRHTLGSLLVSVVALSIHSAVCFAQTGPVSGKEIQETWVGKDLYGATVSGARVYMRLEPDGKAMLSVGNTNDNGTWRIIENSYCTIWKSIRAGQERCFTVVRDGSVFKVANPDGSPSGQFTSIK